MFSTQPFISIFIWMYRWVVSVRERVCFTSAMLCCELNPSKSNSTKYLSMLILFISVCRLCYKKIDQIPASKSVILMSDKRKEKHPTVQRWNFHSQTSLTTCARVTRGSLTVWGLVCYTHCQCNSGSLNIKPASKQIHQHKTVEVQKNTTCEFPTTMHAACWNSKTRTYKLYLWIRMNSPFNASRLMAPPVMQNTQACVSQCTDTPPPPRKMAAVLPGTSHVTTKAAPLSTPPRWKFKYTIKS